MYQFLASWWNQKLPRTVAVTHADLAPSRGMADLGSKTGALLMVLTILCGLFSFILCLIAEAAHSQMTWQSGSNDRGDKQTYQCVYSGSGKMPLLSAASAFLILAIAMVVEHTYMLIAVSKLPSPTMASWQPDFGFDKSLTWQAGFFFVTTWVCFAVAEILLLIGLSVESGHLRNWSKPRPSCLIIRDGLFCAAGVFALATVFLAAGLYLTALRAQKVLQQQENLRREILETSVLYASPPRSPPPHFMTTVEREDPIIREDQNQHPPFVFASVFSKNVV